MNTNASATNHQNENTKTLVKTSDEINLIAQKNKEMENIKRKYELYKNYQPTELLNKDPEFGEVVKYEEFLDEGKEKFDNVLTQYFDGNRHLENDKDFKKLLKIVEEKSKLFYSNYKEEYKYTLQPYEERWYKEAIYSRKESDHKEVFLKKEDPQRKRASSTLNVKVEAMEIEKYSITPPSPNLSYNSADSF